MDDKPSNKRETPFISGILEARYFRFLIFLTGIPLFLFYLPLVVGAAVNLPSSWFGILYSLTGILASIACFAYAFKGRRILLFVIVPAVIFMLITLSGLL